MTSAKRDRAVKDLLHQAKRLAVRYYALTGKPLGVTGEVAEYEAAQKLGLTLEIARTFGYDASRGHGPRRETFQIKGRAVAVTDK